MIKILFLINTLGGGGAERVLVNLVNNMDKTKFDITVETMFSGGVNVDLLSKDIKYINRNAPCPRGIAYIFRFIPARLLYSYFIGKEHYDVIVAYMHGAPVKVISGCRDKVTKKIAWLHNGNPETGTFFKFWFSKKSAFRAYELCNAVVGVSDSVAKAFSDYTGIKDNIKVVFNTNDVSRISALADERFEINAENSFNIVSVGRLSHEKGFDRLFNVCQRLHKEGFNLGVTIVGAGPLENELKTMVSASKDENWFHFTGYQTNPYKYVKNADLFVCSSRTEGLSTAVTEAVILGVPCVSTDVSGAKEILGKNNEYGLVVESSEEGIYGGIKQMLENTDLRQHYSEKAKERAEFFSTESTVKQALDLFYNL